MRFGRSDTNEQLGRELRRDRPQPPAAFVERLAAQLGTSRPRRPALRAGLAACFTGVLIASFAAFGGVGYAANAAKQAVVAIQFKAAPAHGVAGDKPAHARPSASKGDDQQSPDEDQYKPGCGKGDGNHDHSGPPGHHNGFPGKCPH